MRPQDPSGGADCGRDDLVLEEGFPYVEGGGGGGCELGGVHRLLRKGVVLWEGRC